MKAFPIVLLTLAALAGCATEHLSAVAVIPPPPPEKVAKIVPSFTQSVEASVSRLSSTLVPNYKDARIAVATFVSVNALEKGEGLGRILADISANQLVKEGLKLTEVKTRKDLAILNGEGEFILTRQTKQLLSSNSVDVVVSGTYAHMGDKTIVAMKALNAKTGAIVAAETLEISSTLTQQMTRETHK